MNNDNKNTLLSRTEIENINVAIGKAEKLTSGEIVPVVARESSFNGHVPSLAALCVFIACYFLIVWCTPIYMIIPHLSEWATGVSAVIAVICYFFLPTHWLRNLFSSNADEFVQVLQRAELEFYRVNLSHTQSRSGVLLFVSVRERRAVVSADKAISGKLPPETWDALILELTKNIKSKGLGSAIETAVINLGNLLSKDFPAQNKPRNELKNEVILHN